MGKMTPTLGATGAYTLDTKWPQIENKIYACSAIISFQEHLRNDVDVFNTFYSPLKVDHKEYVKDLGLLANMVTLTAADGQVVFVPDTRIIRWPGSGMIPYSHMVVSVSLGLLPDTLDLDHLLTTISEQATATSGVETTAKLHRAPSTGTITVKQHQQMEKARKANIKENTTNHAQVIRLTGELNAAKNKIAALERIIINNKLAGWASAHLYFFFLRRRSCYV